MEWDGVDRDDMNGVPLGYKIKYFLHGILQNITVVNYTTTSVVIKKLIPSSSYVLEVCAYNKIGNGPCDKSIAVTLNSRKFNCLITSMR